MVAVTVLRVFLLINSLRGGLGAGSAGFSCCSICSTRSLFAILLFVIVLGFFVTLVLQGKRLLLELEDDGVSLFLENFVNVLRAALQSALDVLYALVEELLNHFSDTEQDSVVSELWPLEELVFEFKQREHDAFDSLDAFESVVHADDDREHFLRDIVVVRLRNNLHLLFDARFAGLDEHELEVDHWAPLTGYKCQVICYTCLIVDFLHVVFLFIDQINEPLPCDRVHDIRVLNVVVPDGESDQEAQIIFETCFETVVDDALLELLDLVEDLVYLRVQVILSHRP